MRLTDEIVKALQGAIEDGYASVSDFARQANVSGNTITKCLRKETASITDESWRKIYPLIRKFLPKSRKSDESHHRPEDLDTDQKVLLDTFAELPKELKAKRLAALLALAKEQRSDFAPLGSAESKLLLAAFAELPKELKKQTILEFVALAKDQLAVRKVQSAK